MRIGLDARLYGQIGKGIGRYSQKLIENLEKIDQNNEYFVFLGQENFAFYQPQSPNFHKVLAPYSWYSWQEQIFFPALLRKFKLDLVHFLHFNVPLLYSGKFIVTIHDLIHRLPGRQGSSRNFFIYWLKKQAYKLVINHDVKKAEKILTVSLFSREQIISLTAVDPQKVQVIYEAADLPQKGLLEKYKELDLLKNIPYLLYVGNAYVHKNLERLLQAFKIIYSSGDLPQLSLVLVGAIDPFFKRLQHLAAEMGINNNVIFPGKVSDAELAWLYQNALAYVFPSLIEGFGLPGLEAMAYGLPVVSSGAGPMPEIYSDAALYFNPEDIVEMAQKIAEIIKDPHLREELSKKGLKQVEKYLWQKTAQKTNDVYQSLLNG